MSLAEVGRTLSKFQRHLTYLLLNIPSFNVDVENRVRHKMSRWELSCPPGILARRIVKRLPDVAKLVTPRVQTAVFKTLWNGWTTASRFQNESACVLKCSEAVDALGHSIAQEKCEHYAGCPFMRQLLVYKLRLPIEFASKEYFFFAADGLMERTDKVTLLAIGIYAMMLATDHFRVTPPPSSDVVHDFLEEACKRATSGHRPSRSVLHGAMVAWLANRCSI